MALHKCLNNFTGGEISPQLDARIDLQKYDTSCKRIENMRVLPWGGVTFRSGTQFIAETKGSAVTRLIKFTASTSAAYCLELTAGAIRFYKDGARIETSPGVAYEIGNDFAESELFQVQFRQINDIMYMVHPAHPVRKIARIADTNWTTINVTWKYPALLDENIDTGHTLTAAATTGVGVALTASLDTWTADNVGSYFEIRHLRGATKVELDLSVTAPGVTTSGNIKVKGDWTLVTTERWYGQLDIQRSTDAGTSWETVRTFTSAADRNVNASGSQDTAVLFRLRFTCAGDPYGSPPWSGTAPTTFVSARASFEVGDAYIAGLVIIASYADARTVTCNIVNELESTAATYVWSEGAWSNRRGYPRTIGLFEQRLLFAGTSDKPNTLWGSVSGDFENFTYGDTDDAAVAYQFADTEQNPIQWLASMMRIHAGTSGGEFIVSSGNTDEAMSPNNVTVRRQSSYGCEYMGALPIDNGIIFLQRQGRRIREMREMSLYTNPGDFVAPDLALLAEHLTDAGIVQLDYARLPDPTLYCVMGNGQLAVMAYNKEQNINAWSRYLTDGRFESVAAVYGSPSDVVYVVVKRTIGGVAKRYVEVFTAETVVPFSFVHMDAAISTLGPTTVVTGLSHLEGKTVAIIAGVDGHVVTSQVVSGGQITLPSEELFVRVGLPYTGQLTPMSMDQVTGNGTSQGRRRRISEIAIRFKDTRGANYGNSIVSDNATNRWNEEIPFRDTADRMDQAAPMFTGDKVVPMGGGNDILTDLSIYQTQPQPMTVLGIFAKMEVMGE